MFTVEEPNAASKLSNDQKKYLREKYKLEDLAFNYDKPGNEAAMRDYNPAGNDFMKELWQMGLISQKEYASYLSPTSWAIKPLNYDSLPESMKQGFYDDPLASYEIDNELSRTLRRNVSGANLLDAFRTLEIQQNRKGQLSLGTAGKYSFSEEAKMYGRLADLVESIFAD